MGRRCGGGSKPGTSVGVCGLGGRLAFANANGGHLGAAAVDGRSGGRDDDMFPPKRRENGLPDNILLVCPMYTANAEQLNKLHAI